MRIIRMLGLARIGPVVFGVAAALILVAGAFAATLLPFLDDGPVDTRPSEALEAAGGALDADGDGLADAVENQVGSDPERYDTLGRGVPDGWLHHWFGVVDWADPGFLLSPVLEVPDGSLPAAFGGDVGAVPVHALFAFENGTREGPAWWRSVPALDPKEWDNDGDDIADLWLVLHGLDPLGLDPSDPSPGDPSMSIFEKYRAGLDPSSADSDGDGLGDTEERAGLATMKGVRREFTPTDPRQFSSRHDGVPDGYLVRFGLDPHDGAIAAKDPAGDGLDVRTAYAVSAAHCLDVDPACRIPDMVRSGPVVDPTVWDTFGDGIPDAWAVADTTGSAHPLRESASTQAFDSTRWDDIAWSGSSEDLDGLLVDAQNPKPDTSDVTLKDLYEYQRPPGWDETKDGPWWGGIPTDLESPEGALPPAVALRGWSITVDACRGCNETRPPTEAHLAHVHVFADPRSGDTDGDGLSDLEEYFGIRIGSTTPFGRTDPSNPDTDGDGLGDRVEIDVWGTDPLRRDSSGSFLTDGEEVAYWSARHDDAVQLLDSDFEEAKRQYGWLLGPGADLDDLDLEVAHMLHPLGAVTGETPNILSADSDRDGITDGAELQPNRFLDIPTTKARPSTDPARIDSDGDGLPDPWEVRWSRDIFYDCKSACTPPPEAQFVDGWPTDPSKWNSFSSAPDVPSDGHMNLAGDIVHFAAGEPSRSFTNGLAYKYDLHPFVADTDGDGLGDVFEVQWGVDGLPEHAVQRIEELFQSGSDFDWVRAKADRLGARMPAGFTDRPSLAVISPVENDEVAADEDLLGRFFGRSKGTWIAEIPALGESPGPDCTVLPVGLPASGLDHEQGGGKVPSRVGLQAACWNWIPYPLSSDAAHGTDPWLHDFDDDGLPDAWEVHHDKVQGLDAGQASDGSIAARCEDPVLHASLPAVQDLPPIPGTGARGGYCLTNLESYALGLDPGVPDTDDGGLADWLEVALGLKPLDPADDRGEEDWSGDGLPNRVKDKLGLNRFSPDSDGDGLLDGDPVGIEPLPFLAFGQGDGNLCLRRGPDAVPNMAHRPPFLGDTDEEGPLTHSERYDWFVSLGILHDTTPGNRCPGPVTVGADSYPHTLFKREVMRDTWSSGDDQILGAGQGSDPLLWDTSGNGIPDGWLVHWRDHVDDSTCAVTPGDPARAALDPNDPTAAQKTPDGALPVLQNYLAGRPADWSEPRDGPWWGGMDPTCRDTDGDESWYASAFSGGDALDGDWDGDGIDERIDAAPGLGGQVGGLVHWDLDDGRYKTDHAGLWGFLAARAHAFTQDRFDQDADQVPDFLDRARVDLQDVAIVGGSLAHLTKGVEETFRVTGRLVVADAPLPGRVYTGPTAQAAATDGAPVSGATVKVVLSDGTSEAILGFAVTAADGAFVIDASSGATAVADPASVPFSVAGMAFEAGSLPSLPTGVEVLKPGPATLRVVAEPNDALFQQVRFHDGNALIDQVRVYKDVSSLDGAQRFRIPSVNPETQGPAMKAALVGVDESGKPAPDVSEEHVRHTAEAVFAGTSQAMDLDLRALASLEVFPPSARVRAGETLEVTGRLADEQGVPLSGRSVDVDLLHDGLLIADPPSATVLQDGTYSVLFPTGALAPDDYVVRAQAQLFPSDGFLQAPGPETIDVVLAQDTVWSGLFVNDRPVLPGGELDELAASGIAIRLDLTDVVSGQPVEQDVLVRVASIVDGKQRLTVEGKTDLQGRFRLPTTSLPDGLPLSSLRIDVEAGSETSQDQPARMTFFLNPVFRTSVVVEETTTPIGETAFVRGTVLREDGVPVGTGLGSVHVTGDAIDLETTITAGDGRFTFPVIDHDPGISQYEVRFVSPRDAGQRSFLESSPVTPASVTYVSATQLAIDPAEGVRNEPVHVTGAFTLSDGRLADGAVQLRWAEGAWQTVQAKSGVWSADIASREAAGNPVLEARFVGTATLEPSQVTAKATVRTATAIDLVGDRLSGGPDGVQGDLVAALQDQDGQMLAGRPLRVELVGPDGVTRLIEGVTDSSGTLRLILSEIDRPLQGAWKWNVTYGGGFLEAPASASGLFEVQLERTIVFERLPARIGQGETITVQGRVDGLPGDVGTTHIVVALDGSPVGTADVAAGSSWSMKVQVGHELVAGPKTVLATGDGGDFVSVRNAEAVVSLLGGALVHMQESVAADDSRTVALVLEAGTMAADVEITLVRRDDDGRILGVYRVSTDGQGRASLHLGATQQGALSVVHLGDPLLRFDGSTVESKDVAATPSAGRSTVAIAVAGALLAAGLVTTYLVWRARNRGRIEEMFEGAHELLLDPDADAKTVVRQTYEHLLYLLARVGYTPPEASTVRDIAGEVARAFRLPIRPMGEVSRLFERVVYSEEPLGEADRRLAIASFDALSHRVGGAA